MIKILYGICFFVLGSIFASFFGVIIYRVPRGLSVIYPCSKCDYCGHKLKIYENIPVISYLLLKGKCTHCKIRIPCFLFVLEIIGGLSLLFIYIKYGLTIECLLICLISLMMLLISGYDYETKSVLNIFLYILIIINLVLLIYRYVVLKVFYADYIVSSVVGLVLFYGIKKIMSKVLKKDALGSGDVYLATIMGLCFKPPIFLLAISIGSLIGIILNIIFIKLNKKNRNEEIAFCPYLCLGFYIMFIFSGF